MKNRVHVSSEIGSLQRVVVHRPDEGIARISPKRAEELLFDDIVYLPKMQAEHDVFVDVLATLIGRENVLDLSHLLREALGADDVRKKRMIRRIVSYEELPSSAERLLMELPHDKLAEVLISGYYADQDHILFDPIPNFIFTRDIAVTVNDHLVIMKAAKEARFRENFITRFVLTAHPIFKDMFNADLLINLNEVEEFPPSKRGEKVSVEGGDVMVVHPSYLLIGASERTTPHGIRSLARALFSRGVIDNVVQVNIPQERSYMHIDTIFTQIHHNHIVAYLPIVEEGLGSTVDVFRRRGAKTHYPSVKAFWEAEISADIQFIAAGNGLSPYQEREQWTDACNLLAVRPGVAIAYDRNPRTETAFLEAGYDLVPAPDLLRRVREGVLDPATLTNTIITLPSSELSRARGGSHCMSCPIERLPATP